ncbi:MAG: PIG-L family deacetylase, partial [Acidobacteria bacterium]|nr:PIG-L family deacetylase [Acidobacteriota bacterium]
ALDAHVSQFYEWLAWHAGKLDEVPKDPKARLEWLKIQRTLRVPEAGRDALSKRYGAQAGSIK